MSRLSRHIAAAMDPVKLARMIGMDCDPWQRNVLRNPHKRELLVIHRQGGKSTTAAVAAVHAALYEPGSLVLVVSPSQRQSSELFRSIVTLYRALGRPVEAESENTLSLTLENGSRIVALPSDPVTIRGYAACNLLILDEGAFIPDDVMTAVRPMLAVTNGRILAMSTPWGRRGWFWEASRSKEWRMTTVTADQCPRISTEFLDGERRGMGDWRFRQEYLCEFTDLAGRMFATADLEAVFEAGRLGAVPPGALFFHEAGKGARLTIVDAPQARRTPRKCSSPDMRHRYRDGTCLVCGELQPVLTGGL